MPEEPTPLYYLRFAWRYACLSFKEAWYRWRNPAEVDPPPSGPSHTTGVSDLVWDRMFRLHGAAFELAAEIAAADGSPDRIEERHAQEACDRLCPLHNDR